MAESLFVPKGGGGGGTYFDGSQSAELDVEIANGAQYEWNTGLLLGALPNNGTHALHFESRTVSEDNVDSRDRGAYRITNCWKTAPSLPGTILGGEQSVTSNNSDVGLLSNLLDDVQVNAAGEVVVHFDNGKTGNIYLLLKLTLSPVTAAPWSPVAAP
jgi:hypothetical protein